jgi:Zn-finger nucleic acid-binding protein
LRQRAKLCPRCKIPMVYVQEVEKSGSERRVVRYYKCPLCGLKLLDEVMKIIRVNGSVKIIISPTESHNGLTAHQNKGKYGRAAHRRA